MNYQINIDKKDLESLKNGSSKDLILNDGTLLTITSTKGKTTQIQ